MKKNRLTFVKTGAIALSFSALMLSVAPAAQAHYIGDEIVPYYFILYQGNYSHDHRHPPRHHRPKHHWRHGHGMHHHGRISHSHGRFTHDKPRKHSHERYQENRLIKNPHRD
jgi:hypothetical protein